ncbi:hypothetical protein Taro_040502 [Colocasia esculenta]|uniref:CCHC-type domain-containing protein n=1 Tax=Colocasia esculenta TaxID=4460 RepID=A0A843WQL6_COLES|nr:hypothetical protein [Colocasia esculenta]
MYISTYRLVLGYYPTVMTPLYRWRLHRSVQGCIRNKHSTYPTFDMPDPPQSSDVLIKPPTTKKLPGKPRKRRIYSRGKVEHVYICSRCKQIGHNRRTCSNSPHNPE